MAEVDILLASYNGEKYISEQIESILAQTFQDFRLIIRDDGSTDRTPEIIGEYEQKYPGRIKVVHDDAVCRYHAKNFFQLIKYARADYIMFSDQDDYWLKWKIDITLDFMKRTEKAHPSKGVLVFAGLQAADARLNLLELRNCALKPERYSFESILNTSNCVAGCTVMVNRKIYENLGEYADCISYHDRWAALVAGSCGIVCYVPMALMLYRLHGKNASGRMIGVNEETRMMRIKKFFLHPLSTLSKNHASFDVRKKAALFFRERYKDKMYPSELQHLDDYLGLFDRSIITRIKSLRRTKYIEPFGVLTKFIQVLSILSYSPD